MIKNKVKNFAAKFIQTIPRKKIADKGMEYNKRLRELNSFIEKQSDLTLKKMEAIKIKDEIAYKWVGGQMDSYHNLYAIANGSEKILRYSDYNGNIEYFGMLPKKEFKWTGGCCYKGNIYGFPRAENSLLKINIEKKEAKCIAIGLTYNGEHHYGGVLTKEGIIFQPPRNTDHILTIDLNTYHCRQIPLTMKWLTMKWRYCGSILHPNGFIYFLPERGDKVIKFNPVTERFEFIGNYLDCMVFDVVVAQDGNIYGFSAYCSGILKISVQNNHTEMIHQEFQPGCCGTKLGWNGKLYGIPGEGDDFWEYDLKQDVVKSVGKTKELGNGKCAGGAVDRNGDIYGIPAMGNYLYKLCFNAPISEISEELFQCFYEDNY